MTMVDNWATLCDPHLFEEKWRRFWEDEKIFQLDGHDGKEAFSIVMPPPNVTSKLHMGHALNATIQDVLVRHAKMSGKSVAWIPGTDHAGIATQNVVEKHLWKTQSKRRSDYAKEEFLEQIWSWKEQSGNKIIQQLKMLGCACDWSKTNFTMSPKFSKLVREVFCRFYEKGWVFRGRYLINQCLRCETALSDEEVERTEEEGFLYFIKYPLEGESRERFVEIATTRPETLPGDVAVAVNPNDEKYADFIGKLLVLPLIGRKIPVIADRRVDKTFGSGAVKVTPAHDRNDFDMGVEHGLEGICIMDANGSMNQFAGAYQGLDRYACRQKILEDLDVQGYLRKSERHRGVVSRCYRCRERVEPLVSLQWFVKISELAGKALDAVESGEIDLRPRKWISVFSNWMKEKRDWCISRQIAWGHLIPVLHCQACKKDMVFRTDSPPARCLKCDSEDVKQETDVLDTWFSSMLWPFGVFGWPKKTLEFQKFYPTSVLSTAPEILFFWVARMIMAGLHLTGQIPFRKVRLHPVVRDVQGRKMSKSLGNGIDPLDVIRAYGVDALRFTLIYLSASNEDIRLSFGDKDDPFKSGTRFVNKLWNVSRYIAGNGIPKKLPASSMEFEDLSFSGRYVLSNLHGHLGLVQKELDDCNVSGALRILRDFVLRNFCDWYVELHKIDVKARTISDFEKVMLPAFVLNKILLFSHVFMPFVTEEINKKLGQKPLSKQAYPVKTEAFSFLKKWSSDPGLHMMSFLQHIVNRLRVFRTEWKIPAGKIILAHLKMNVAQTTVLSTQFNMDWLNRYVESLVHVRFILCEFEGEMGETVSLCGNFAEDEWTVVVPKSQLQCISIDITNVRKRLNVNVMLIKKLDLKLKNPQFISRAKPEVVELEKKRKRLAEQEVERLRLMLASYSK